VSDLAGTTSAVDRLQEGIYFRPNARPGRCYRLLLLNASPHTTLGQIEKGIRTIWARLDTLKNELAADLRPDRLQAPPGNTPPGSSALTCLLGFGAPLFEDYESLECPVRLTRLAGDPPFPALAWVDRGDRQTGEAHLLLQFIAESELAVSRAVAETWLLIRSRKLRFEVAGLYAGFNREDRRSWLGFHDGISNIEPELRREAIEARSDAPSGENPAWMDGGTYMGYLRLALDLEMWNALSVPERERAVGRREDTGCPILHMPRVGDDVRLAGCPRTVGPDSVEYRNPPAASLDSQDLTQFAHMNRANVNRHRGFVDPADRDNRIFRQGYEFLEGLSDGRIRIGVNFVSFQRSLMCLTAILGAPGWLGDANFGGEKPQPSPLMSLIGGGLYAVPPTKEPFPGAALF
jgi:Dyp-type peroxidase family